MPVVFTAGQHSPGDAGQFVGDRDHDFVARSTLSQPVHPLPESSAVVLDAKEHGAGTVDQHATQIDIAALAHAEQLLLAPGGVLPRHDANPGREVASAAEGSPVADGGHSCCGDQMGQSRESGVDADSAHRLDEIGLESVSHTAQNVGLPSASTLLLWRATMSNEYIAGSVLSVLRYPVKSMMGEELTAADVRKSGLIGDRAYALIDNSTGKIASAKNPRKWARLFDCHASFVEPPRKDHPLPPVRIMLPDGSEIRSDEQNTNAILSHFFEREVTLAETAPESPALEEYWPDIDGL